MHRNGVSFGPPPTPDPDPQKTRGCIPAAEIEGEVSKLTTTEEPETSDETVAEKP